MVEEASPPRNKLIALIWMARPWNSLALDTTICIGAAVLATARVSAQTLVPTLLVALAGAFIHGAGTVLNDYTDIEADKVLFPNRPLALGFVKPNDALIFWALLSATAVGIGWFLDIKVFGIMLLLWLFGIWYSWWPRIKDILFFNELFIGFAFTLEATAAMWAVGGPVTSNALATILFFGLGITLWVWAGRHFRSFIDYETDMEHGKITLPVKLGVPKSSKLVSFMLAFSFIISPLAYLFGTLSPFFLVTMTILAAWQTCYCISLAGDPSPQNARKLYGLIRLPIMLFSIAFILGTLL